MNTEELRRYFTYYLKRGRGFQQEIVFSFLCEAAEEAKGGVVLDVGAGHQRYRAFFGESIYVAQEHPVAGQQLKKISEYDILCDAKSIPLRDSSVDLILSTSSFEHMEFPDLFFAESFRVLKPGGSLYINVPFVYSEHETPYDFQRLTRYGLRREYSRAGFERITVCPTSSSIYTAQYFFRYAVKEDSKRLGAALWGKVATKTMHLIISCVCGASLWLFDKGPMDETTFPVGWIATGYKAGKKENGGVYRAKRDFINENARCDGNLKLRDGRIIPT